MSDSPQRPLLDAQSIESLLLLAEGDPSILESVYGTLIDDALKAAELLTRGDPSALPELAEQAEVLKAQGLAELAARAANQKSSEQGASLIRAEALAIRRAIAAIGARVRQPGGEVAR